jgi:hypothetical protein
MKINASMCWKYFCHLFQRQGETTYVQDKDCKMEIVGNIVFGVLMLNLDTLSLEKFLPCIPSSNGSVGYIVGNFIPIPFQWYMAFPLTP